MGDSGSKRSKVIGNRSPSIKKPPQANKVIIADIATEQKIIGKRSEPEFKDKVVIQDGQRIVLKSETIFMCVEPGCKGMFTNVTSLNRHANHHRNRRIRCNFCKTIFKENSDKEEHLIEFHPNLDENPDANPMQCAKCRKTCTNAFALKRHILRSHQKRKYPCLLCGFEYTQLEGLQQHLKRKHLEEGQEAPKYTCHICEKVYNYSPDLRRHIQRDHRPKDEQFKCVICNTVYNDKDVYRNHLTNHTKLKSFSCHICHKSFKNNYKLGMHEKTNSHKEMVASKERLRNRPSRNSAGPTSTKVAEVIRKSVEELKQMTKQELIEFCSKRIAKIVLCRVDENKSKFIARKDKRRKVMKMIEENENPKLSKSKKDLDLKNNYMKCVDCEETFSDLKELRIHEKSCFREIRNGTVQRFVCKVCKTEFKRRHQLVSHSIVHSKIRPYKCDYCEKTFKRTECLIAHEKYIHFGGERKKENRTYTCLNPGCSKTYTTKKSLQRHVLNNHVGERYPCSDCEKVFTRSDYLKLHREIQHTDQPTLLECKPCNKTFRHRARYLVHSKKPRHIRKMKAFNEGKITGKGKAGGKQGAKSSKSNSKKAKRIYNDENTTSSDSDASVSGYSNKSLD